PVIQSGSHQHAIENVAVRQLVIDSPDRQPLRHVPVRWGEMERYGSARQDSFVSISAVESQRNKIRGLAGEGDVKTGGATGFGRSRLANWVDPDAGDVVVDIGEMDQCRNHASISSIRSPGSGGQEHA